MPTVVWYVDDLGVLAGLRPPANCLERRTAPGWLAEAGGQRLRASAGWVYGAGVVLVVAVVVVCVPAGAGGLVAGVVDVDVLVLVVLVDALLVTVVVGEVLVTVVVGAVVVTVVVEVDFLLTVEVAPKNVVGWPLPVIDRPARRSGTV
jgi:hypothetical protein